MTTSWVAAPRGSDFPIENLPCGVFEPAAGEVAVRAAPPGGNGIGFGNVTGRIHPADD